LIRRQLSRLGRGPHPSRLWAMTGLAIFVVCTVTLLVGGCGAPNERRGAGTADSSSEVANLLLIVVDTLRDDHVGPVGGATLTPSLDVLAENGIRLHRAYAHIPATGPSHASIFTGLLPPTHGVKRNAQALDESFSTISEVLSSRGFRTGAVVSLGVMASKFGFGQGFDSYDEAFDRQWFRPADEITDSALAMIGGWPRADRFFAFVHYSDPHEPYAPPGLDYPELDVIVDGSKVNTVHADGLGIRIPLNLAPGRHEIRFEAAEDEATQTLVFQQLRLVGRKAKLYLEKGWRAEAGTPPERANHSDSLPVTLSAVIDASGAMKVECTLRFFVTEKLATTVARERYRLEVQYVDRQIGRLLERLEEEDRLSDTVVVVTSDHGEGLGDHGLLGHIHQLYDTLIRVPLIMAAPGISRENLTQAASVRHVDLRPTVLSLLGVDDPVPGVGVDLGPYLRGDRPPPEVEHLCMTYRPLARADLHGLIVDSGKLIRNEGTGELEVYDLELDPGELDNLAVESEEAGHEIANLVTMLNDLLANTAGSTAIPNSQEPLTRSEREMLEALGYASD